MSYSKLSIERLANAFTKEETRGGRVFALFMNKDTRRVLQGFLRALETPESRWSDCDLWGATFVLDERIPLANILLGTILEACPAVDDFVKALDFWIAKKPLADEGQCGTIGDLWPDVWSTLLPLF